MILDRVVEFKPSNNQNENSSNQSSSSPQSFEKVKPVVYKSDKVPQPKIAIEIAPAVKQLPSNGVSET